MTSNLYGQEPDRRAAQGGRWPPRWAAGTRPRPPTFDLVNGGRPRLRRRDRCVPRARVGPTGKANGMDMTPAMLARARANAERRGLERRIPEATIDNLPLPDASVDCVISNCVINLSPEKTARSGRLTGFSSRAGDLPSRMSSCAVTCPRRSGTVSSSGSAAWPGALEEAAYRTKLGQGGIRGDRRRADSGLPDRRCAGVP